MSFELKLGQLVTDVSMNELRTQFQRTIAGLSLNTTDARSNSQGGFLLDYFRS